MSHTFLAASTFGTYGLNRLLQAYGYYLQFQLLYVPNTVTGDKSTWTWDANWKNYVIDGGFSGTGGSLNLDTSGATPPAAFTAYTQAESYIPGAYVSGNYPYGLVFNNTSDTNYDYNYVAVFGQQLNNAQLSNVFQPNAYLYDVTYKVDENNDVLTTTVLPNEVTLVLFDSADPNTGSTFTVTGSFDEWVALLQDAETDTADSEPFPYKYAQGYSQNKLNTPSVLQNYKDLLGVSELDPTTSFMAELLNVTGAAPSYEEGWDGWSTYRINRYSVVPFQPSYDYAEKTGSYSFVYDGTTYDVVLTGVEVSHKNKVEFIFNPPTSGSYTYTHIAIFINSIDTPPTQGEAYTYPDTTKLIGVVELASSVTVASTDPKRAYPFQFSYMKQPSFEVVEAVS